jgi:tRNA 2-thiouridine synthesizing protein E
MTLRCDKEGFLRQLTDWTPTAAEQLAAAENIILTEPHWEIINITRSYYQQFNVSPPTRVLIRIIGAQLGPEKGRSIYVMQLFGGKPAKLVAKIAGLPKPTNCD